MIRLCLGVLAAGVISMMVSPAKADITSCAFGLLPAGISCELPAPVGYDIRRDGGSGESSGRSGTGSSGSTNGGGQNESGGGGSEGPGQSDTKGGGKSQGRGAENGSNGRGHNK